MPSGDRSITSRTAQDASQCSLAQLPVFIVNGACMCRMNCRRRPKDTKSRSWRWRNTWRRWTSRSLRRTRRWIDCSNNCTPIRRWERREKIFRQQKESLGRSRMRRKAKNDECNALLSFVRAGKHGSNDDHSQFFIPWFLSFSPNSFNHSYSSLSLECRYRFSFPCVFW